MAFWSIQYLYKWIPQIISIHGVFDESTFVDAESIQINYSQSNLVFPNTDRLGYQIGRTTQKKPKQVGFEKIGDEISKNNDRNS